jgi:hypothetical protein
MLKKQSYVFSKIFFSNLVILLYTYKNNTKTDKLLTLIQITDIVDI